MVNLGRSRGCVTCRKRRVKCDEAKPGCMRCLSLHRECGGYARSPRQVRFRASETADTLQEKKLGKRRRERSSSGSSGEQEGVAAALPMEPSVAASVADNALNFFLAHFATLGRDVASARGFFELLCPAVSSERACSALSMALSALAMRMFRHWRGGGASSSSSSSSSNNDLVYSGHAQLHAAIRRLRQAANDPIESCSPATALAALVLQFDDNMTAVWDRREVGRMHHDGAVALLLHHQSQDNLRTPYGRHLLNHVMHIEVSSAVRQKRPFRFSPLYVRRLDISGLNQSSKLDMIGIGIANLQYAMLQTCHPSTSPAEGANIEGLWKLARKLEWELKTWSNDLPKEWHPSKIHGASHSLPMMTYSDTCEVYPSIQIAAIWNVWRCYRLIVLKVQRFCCLSKAPSSPPSSPLPSSSYTEEIQEIFNSICFSVPFFLGNRNTRSTFHDITNSILTSPSLHDIIDNTNQEKSGNIMSKNQHLRHVICQGAWHILSPLVFVLDYIANDKHVDCCADCMPLEQQQWIEKQLVRSATVLGLQFDGFSHYDQAASSLSEIQSLKFIIRRGLKMTSGP